MQQAFRMNERSSSMAGSAAVANLVEPNMRLVLYVARRYRRGGVAMEELISEGNIGLMKAAYGYRPERGVRFSTYAARCIENEIRMFLRRNRRHSGCVSLDAPLKPDSQGRSAALLEVLESPEGGVSERLERVEERHSLHAALRQLPDREYELIQLRYGLNGNGPLSQQEAAARIGISQSYASRLEAKILRTLQGVLQ